jgi:O-acetyl-ADP-ribose deacetylase (regulator of RNase III)
VARIELWNGDICDLEVDAIVSPAATSLWMSSGVAGELKRTGGDQIEFAAIRQGPVTLGDAIVTPAGRLAAKVVVHAVSLERDRRTSGPAIDRAARSAMARVRELGLTTVAFPALGTGVGGFPLDEAAQIAVNAVRDELQTPSSIEHVIFALRGAAAYEAFARALSAGEPSPSRPLLEATAWQPVGPDRPLPTASGQADEPDAAIAPGPEGPA